MVDSLRHEQAYHPSKTQVKELQYCLRLCLRWVNVAAQDLIYFDGESISRKNQVEYDAAGPVRLRNQFLVYCNAWNSEKWRSEIYLVGNVDEGIVFNQTEQRWPSPR